MKKTFLLVSFLSVTTLARALPQVLLSPVTHLYIPSGFDSNDSVEVLVSGHFPNPCYGRHLSQVTVKGKQISVALTSIRRRAPEACPDVIVPFTEVVSLGSLGQGTYQVRVNGRLSETLQVQDSTTNAIDEHYYAIVNHIERKSETDFVLHGRRYSDCMVLDRIKVVSNGKDTLSVLPVIKQVGDFCPMKGDLVEYPVRLNLRALPFEAPLIHVRTADGKSVNAVVTREDRR